MKVRYYCHFGKGTGYSRAAQDYLLALHNHSTIELEIVPFTRGDKLEERYRVLETLIPSDLSKPCDVAIYHATPHDLATLTVQNLDHTTNWHLANTTWEVEFFPFGKSFENLFDGVIVPSAFCARQMRDAMLDMPTVVIPHCFDPNFWDPLAFEKEVDQHPFRFYTIGSWSSRKNIQGVIQAYLHAFHKPCNVELVIQSRDADLVEARDLIYTASMLHRDSLPPLSIRTLYMDQTDLLMSHCMGDCYVSASRGEGFGLGSFEAALMGNCVISPSQTGEREYLEFCDPLANIGAIATPVFPLSKVTVSGNQAKSDLRHIPGTNCKNRWLEPDLIDISTAMLTVADDPNSRRWFRQSRLRLEKDFSYQMVAKQFAKTLEDLVS